MLTFANKVNLPSRRPPWPPSYIDLSYSQGHSWHDESSDALGLWRISADVRNDDAPRDPDPVVAHVGDIEILLVDPAETDDVVGLLHGHTAQLDRITTTIFASDAPAATGRALIVTRARIDYAWRGFGLGITLIGHAIKRLAGGCRIAACYPAPIPGEGPNDLLDVEDPGLALIVLAELFEQLGFDPHARGVLVLDLSEGSLNRATATLRRRLQLA